MSRKILVAVFSAALISADLPAQLRPYGRVSGGGGTLGYEGGTVRAMDIGVVLSRRVDLGVEAMQLKGGVREYGRWAGATARLYPFSSDPKFAGWLSIGGGSAIVRTRAADGSPRFRTEYRFSGGGYKAAVGLDFRIGRHFVTSSSVGVRRTAFSGTERSSCTGGIDSQGLPIPWSCSAWERDERGFQAIELSLSVGVR